MIDIKPTTDYLNEMAAAFLTGGYRVLVRPRESQLPEFLRPFSPDLIAEGDEETVVVQAKRPNQEFRKGYWEDLAAAVREHPNWRVEVVLDSRPEALPNSLGDSAIEQRLLQARQLSESGNAEAAFLLSWSATEAALRLVALKCDTEAKDYRARPLIARLYSEGLMDREDYDEFQELIELRNSVAHGLVAIALSARDVKRLDRLTRRLLRELPRSRKPRASHPKALSPVA